MVDCDFSSKPSAAYLYFFPVTCHLAALALHQGGYDWGYLAYAVGFGGSMIWFGSSAGVALSNLFPEAKSVGAWLRHGWHIAIAYVIGFAALLLVLGWQEDTKRARPVAAAPSVEEPPLPPRFGFVKTPMWNLAEADTREAFDELSQHLGGHVEEVQLPEVFNDAVAWHRTIMEADIARSFELEYTRGKEKLSSQLIEMIERGQQVRAIDYNHAADCIPILNILLNNVFNRCNAILTPAAPGEAPVGLESTGNPVFCTLWTLCRMPAITLPLMQGSHGMPIGVQLVGPRWDDARLLCTARWLVDNVTEEKSGQPVRATARYVIGKQVLNHRVRE